MSVLLRPLRGLSRALLVVVGAIVFTTLIIEASDMAGGVKGNVASLLFGSKHTGPCQEHEVLLKTGAYALCLDVFEASAGASCPEQDPQSEVATAANVGVPECQAVTVPNRLPWRFVSYTQAEQLCARAGKRLPTAAEWHRSAVGIADPEACVLSEAGPQRTGTTACASPAGVFDLVGNVWEWVGGAVHEGQLEGRTLPATGYVDLVDEAGLVVRTVSDPNPAFGNDYAWTQSGGVRGVLRGGFYGSGEDGGVFAQNLSVPLDFAAAGVGFRCVRDVAW